MPFLNQPQGSTTLTDFNFNGLTGDGWNNAYPGSPATIQTRGDCPESPTSVLRMRYDVGFPGGIGPGNIYHPLPNSYTQLYWGYWWMPTANFEQHLSGGTKLNELMGGQIMAVIPRMDGFDATTRQISVYLPALDSISNAHLSPGVGPAVGTRVVYGNVSSGNITMGTWNLLEFYVQASTGMNSRDGILRWWVNNTLTGNFTNANLPDRWPEYQFAPTWGGTGGTKTRLDDFYYDHVRIATGGTAGTGGGGGGGTNPPPQTVLDNLTPANASIPTTGTQNYTIGMSGPVAANTVINLSSSVPAIATVPVSHTITAGSTTGLFAATAVAQGATTISAVYNGVTKAASLQVQQAQTPGSDTTYDYAADFGGTQGFENWYYLEEDNTQMTFNGGTQFWNGTKGSLQLIWDSGFHPAASGGGSKLRWVTPAGGGTVAITGNANDLDAGGGTGATFRILHNGVTVHTRVIVNGQTTGGAYSLSGIQVAAGDTIDFLVTNTTADYTNNSTSLDPVIVLTTVTTDPDPPDPPPPVIAVTDLFTTQPSILVGTTFTMTVRVSAIVTVDTAVEIQVGSTSLLESPSSVLVTTGNSEATFIVTALLPGAVTVRAIMNGTRTVNLDVQPVVEEPPPEEPELPGAPAPMVSLIEPNADGARVTVNGFAKAIGFAYDAQPEFVVIPDFTGDGTFTHVFTWPSGTTTVRYRVQGDDGIWQEPASAPFSPPPPPPPPPHVNRAVTDAAGVQWQLKGKPDRPPFLLQRNGTVMNETYGKNLRLSGDGYMELLQTNGVWIRRNGDAWESV